MHLLIGNSQVVSLINAVLDSMLMDILINSLTKKMFYFQRNNRTKRKTEKEFSLEPMTKQLYSQKKDQNISRNYKDILLVG